MDSNRDGIVDFDEFVAATLHVHQLEETDSEKWQKRSRAAFSKFDFDGDGYITAEELKIVSADGDPLYSFLAFQETLKSLTNEPL